MNQSEGAQLLHNNLQTNLTTSNKNYQKARRMFKATSKDSRTRRLQNLTAGIGLIDNKIFISDQDYQIKPDKYELTLFNNDTIRGSG